MARLNYEGELAPLLPMQTFKGKLIEQLVCLTH
jgi:hypothetical protein